jgi:hypothetical protein
MESIIVGPLSARLDGRFAEDSRPPEVVYLKYREYLQKMEVLTAATKAYNASQTERLKEEMFMARAELDEFVLTLCK